MVWGTDHSHLPVRPLGRGPRWTAPLRGRGRESLSPEEPGWSPARTLESGQKPPTPTPGVSSRLSRLSWWPEALGHGLPCPRLCEKWASCYWASPSHTAYPCGRGAEPETEQPQACVSEVGREGQEGPWAQGQGVQGAES